VKGCRTGADDHVRAEVIRRLMCDLEVRYDEIERTRGIRFDRTFEAELGELRSPGGLIEIGVVHETPTGLVVDPAARTLVRNVCRVFDRRGREPKGSGRMSSSV